MATIRIKTPHGYLSLQPNGQIEFRNEPGAWETFTIEGLEGLIAPATGSPATAGQPASSPSQPAAPPPQPHGPAPVHSGVLADAIDLSLAEVAARDCPDVRQWPIIAPLEMVEFAASEKFERGDTMVEFPGRDALPPAFGSQGAISYTLWMGCRIRGTWYVLPAVECIRAYVPTGRLLAPDQVRANLFYYADKPLCDYQPAAGEQVALFCTTGDTRRQNVQAVPVAGRTNVVLVPFSVGVYRF